jgi:palmitoyl-protein thioesterase
MVSVRFFDILCDASVKIYLHLGDSHSSPGMLQLSSRIKEMHPGIYVHSIYIDEDLDKDRRAGFVR